MAALIICPLSWLLGVVWAIIPIGLLVGACLGSVAQCILLAVDLLWRCVSGPAYSDFFTDKALREVYELYMIHVRLLGDLPRLVICVIFLRSLQSKPDLAMYACITLSSVCLFMALLNHRRTIAQKSYAYFDHIIMELESD